MSDPLARNAQANNAYKRRALIEAAAYEAIVQLPTLLRAGGDPDYIPSDVVHAAIRTARHRHNHHKHERADHVHGHGIMSVGQSPQPASPKLRVSGSARTPPACAVIIRTEHTPSRADIACVRAPRAHHQRGTRV